MREEAPNHFIFLDARHIHHVYREYVNYYNGARPSQALHAIPNPYPELMKQQAKTGRVVAIPVLSGVQHDDRRAASLLTKRRVFRAKSTGAVNLGTGPQVLAEGSRE